MNKVYLYTFKISKNLKAIDILNDQELFRFSRMGSEKRKLEFLNSRFLIKTVLSFHGKKPRIQEGLSGKPYVRGFKFNISHSDNSIVMALGKDELGVDLELSRGTKHFKEISKKYFSKKEFNYIFKAKSKNEQIKRFKRLWALKESYIKAFRGVLTKRSIKIYFDLKNNRTENVPSKKQVCFAYNKKFNIALCVVGKLQKNNLQVFTLLKNKKVQKSNLRFDFLN